MTLARVWSSLLLPAVVLLYSVSIVGCRGRGRKLAEVFLRLTGRVMAKELFEQLVDELRVHLGYVFGWVISGCWWVSRRWPDSIPEATDVGLFVLPPAPTELPVAS